MPALALEKPLYVRERNDGLYRPITYLLAKLFDELFITIFASAVFSCAVWFLVQVLSLCTLSLQTSIMFVHTALPKPKLVTRQFECSPGNTECPYSLTVVLLVIYSHLSAVC